MHHTTMSEPDTSVATKVNPDYSMLLDRPIVVGYAFGPKKMSTMGVVMAEASKTKFTAEANLSYYASSAFADTYNPAAATEGSDDNVQRIVSPELDDKDCEEERVMHLSLDESEDREREGECGNKTNKSQTCSNVIFSMTDNGYRSSSRGSACSLAHIVRKFQSTCSDSGSTEYGTAVSTNTNTDSHRTATTTSSDTLGLMHSFGNGLQQQRPIVRVSFVPLDPDYPFQDQHGGKIDIILHKLTEDILCMSQLHSSQKDGRCQDELSASDQAAIRRVQRLADFRREQPHCCLVDDPDRVQIVMSRSEIASKLQTCLRNVATKSGMHVSSPKYSVVSRLPNGHGETSQTTSQHIERQLQGLSYPIIVKPLIAAGTKASHAMAVLMDSSGLHKVASKSPCLCQEFSNHDTLLYKVYVLGDYVSVHQRRSLPNLPRDAKSRYNYVEFDSHRPYPRLSDFGYEDDEVDAQDGNLKKRQRDQSQTFNDEALSSQKPHNPQAATLVSVDEVMPVVDALKQAFGLDLFGFDVLIVSATKEYSQQTMLVVDVNYFPSYKEVQNFPSLLAKYLMDRAIESRRLAMANVRTMVGDVK
ncbi:hypothetical protein MPSEU_000003300 [Mayamaea pseudoterrestris]|nr:hypothetical protein MPSEU_000003300 [Mayamaea pseudoterrestris]